MTGLETKSTDVLLVIRKNLQKGLDKVVEHMENGTMDEVSKGSTPRAAGATTLVMLITVNTELLSRGVEQEW